MAGGSCVGRGCGASALECVQRTAAQKGREKGGVEDTGAEASGREEGEEGGKKGQMCE